MTPTAQRATVVGAGLMGHGIAQVLLAGGMAVRVHDPDATVLAGVPERVAANLEALGEDPARASQLHLEPDLERAVADAQWVFEAAPERLELKQGLFERLDAAAPPDAVLATNTSVISVGEIAARVRRTARVVGTHWWNPPFLVPLVEVVQAEGTSDATVQRTMELLEALGKTPVHVARDVPGFVGNRLQHALWREAFDLVDSGVCTPETIDTVVKAGFGSRLPVLGPVENADLIGLDLTLDIHEYLLPRLHPPSAPAAGLRSRVDVGKLGMAAGAGYRTWAPGEADAVRERLRAHLTTAAATRA